MPRSPPSDHHRSRHRGDPYQDFGHQARSKHGYGSYRILLVSNLNYKVNDNLLRQALEDEFGRFGDLTVKLNHDSGERVAYLYFRSYEEAKEARHAKSRMILFDKPIHIEPIVEEPPPRRKRTPSPPMDYRGMSPVSRRRAPSVDRMHVYHRSTSDHHGPPPFRRNEKKEKFPNYLHHIPPEEDDKATRTLFVGNLEVTISEAELRRLFERYGVVEDIDVKRPPPGQGNAYAFIKFLNLDMAHRAKVELSGQYIGKFQCKIGYGKATPTTRIWVGGLGNWTSLGHLEREFDRFGAIRKVDFVKGESHAYIQYDSIDAAQAACQEMRGFALGGPDKRLRLDFADPDTYAFGSGSGGGGYPNGASPGEDGGGGGSYRASRRAPPEDSSFYSREEGEYSNGRKRPHTPDNGDAKYSKYRRGSTSPSDGRRHPSFSPKDLNIDKERISIADSVSSILDLAKCCPVAWNGSLILKSSSFSTKMHLCSGDSALVDQLIKTQCLRITQRLRLDQSKLEDVQKRVTNAGADGSCILLTMAGNGSTPADAGDAQARPLKNLVGYLKQKEAAGVVTLAVKKVKELATSAVLYAFPPCDFAFDLLKKIAPNLTDATNQGKDDYLVVVVVNGQ
ncbi:RNA-binding protein spenito [Galendromus occidentalis]|uniref:RNA-binding protein spenito n=1 Tax=Galendromus occidentalis TaxID=34638 RepID=A0AAJ6QYF9_9ACAR|nr:RNA-binding protein spenito [Galendromus occidentalis]